MERPVKTPSTVATVCMVVFILCCLCGILFQTAWIAIPAVPCWLIGYVVQSKGQRKYAHQMELYRNFNAAKYPEVFGNPPPTKLDESHNALLKLFDCESCMFLGTCHRSDVLILLERFQDSPQFLGNGQNDIPIDIDSLEHIIATSPANFSNEFLESVKKPLDLEPTRSLVLRWFPSS
jgi:hypothetical protein